MKPASVVHTRVAWVEYGMKLKEAGESKGEMQQRAGEEHEGGTKRFVLLKKPEVRGGGGE